MAVTCLSTVQYTGYPRQLRTYNQAQYYTPAVCIIPLPLRGCAIFDIAPIPLFDSIHFG